MANSIYLPSGTLLMNGKYRIVEKLGQGTFGITYMATAKTRMEGNLGSIEVEAKVAIKEFYLRDFNLRDESTGFLGGTDNEFFKNYRKKFRKEAQHLTRLSHPGIIQVLDVFDDRGTTYYAMEFVEGETLDDYLLSKGRLSEDEAVAVIKEIATALDYMHSKKMLHLDIKPKNIMRSSSGSYRIIDFGLSKIIGADGESESSSSLGLGSPGYAPLEQASFRSDGTFPATLDIYALGATLFKMLTGQRPPDPTSILNHGFPASTLEEAGVSKKITAVVRKAMSPASVDRYPTIGDFLLALNGPIEEDRDITKAILPKTENIREPEAIVVDPPKPANRPVVADKKPVKRKGISKIMLFVLLALIAGAASFFIIHNSRSTTEVPTDSDSTTVIRTTPEKASPEITPKASSGPETVTDMVWSSPVHGKVKYTGEVIEVNGKQLPDGEGVAKFDNGDVYRGSFVKGTLQGKGHYQFADGSYFEGRLKNDDFFDGVFYDVSRKEYFKGTFTDGSFDKGSWHKSL